MTGDTPSEVEGLVDTINSLMQRLDHALTALRNFTGNVSHHLRTPLATVRAQPALAMRAKVRGSVSAPPKNRCRPPCHGGADRHRRPRPLPDRRAIALDYEGPVRAIAAAEPVLLQELLRNLIDNVVRHSGRGAHVTVRVTSPEGSLCLEVKDNGPGLPSPQLAAFDAALWRRMPP